MQKYLKKRHACYWAININLLNTDTNHNVSDFYDIVFEFFSPYILQPTRLTENSKTLIDIFSNSIDFNTFSGNLTSQISDHLPQILILKYFYHKTLINSNVFERNYRFFNHDEFKNDLKDISWDNILSSDDISASLAFDLFFARVNTLLDEHAPNHKLSKKGTLLKAKTWINKNIQGLMRERDTLFKRYCNENNPILKVAKHNKYKNARNVVIFKVKQSKKEYYQNYFQKYSKNAKKPGTASNQL